MEENNTLEIIKAEGENIPKKPIEPAAPTTDTVKPELGIANDINEEDLPDIIFTLQDEKYSISSRYVLHIETLPKITPTVGLAPYYRGTVLFNGKSVNVTDLRVLFGITSFEEELEANMQQRIRDHQNWVSELEASVRENRPFKLTTDPHNCAFGKWFYSFKTDNTSLNIYMKGIDAPHRAIHATGELVQKLMREGKQEEAQAAIDKMKTTQYARTLDLLSGMARVYREGKREMLIMMRIDGVLRAMIVDSISSIKKLNDICELPQHMPHGSSEYIEKLAKDYKNNKTDVIMMIDAHALI